MGGAPGFSQWLGANLGVSNWGRRSQRAFSRGISNKHKVEREEVAMAGEISAIRLIRNSWRAYGAHWNTFEFPNVAHWDGFEFCPNCHIGFNFEFCQKEILS